MRTRRKKESVRQTKKEFMCVCKLLSIKMKLVSAIKPKTKPKEKNFGMRMLIIE